MKLYRVSKVEAELTVRLIKEELGRKVGGLRIIVVVLLKAFVAVVIRELVHVADQTGALK